MNLHFRIDICKSWEPVNDFTYIYFTLLLVKDLLVIFFKLMNKKEEQSTNLIEKR